MDSKAIWLEHLYLYQSHSQVLEVSKNVYPRYKCYAPIAHKLYPHEQMYGL